MSRTKKIIAAAIGTLLSAVVVALVAAWFERPIPDVAILSIREADPDRSVTQTIPKDIRDLTRGSRWIKIFGEKESLSLIKSELKELDELFYERSSASLESLKSIKKEIKNAALTGNLAKDEQVDLLEKFFELTIVQNTITGEIDRFNLYLKQKDYKGTPKVVNVIEIARVNGPAKYVVQFPKFEATHPVAKDGADEADIYRLRRRRRYYDAVAYFDVGVLLEVIEHVEKEILAQIENATKLIPKLTVLISRGSLLEINLSVANSGKRALTVSPYGAFRVYSTGKEFPPILIVHKTRTKESSKEIPSYVTIGADESTIITFRTMKPSSELGVLFRTAALSCQAVIENVQQSLFSTTFIKTDKRIFGSTAEKNLQGDLFDQLR